MKLTKFLAIILLAAALLCSFAACGNDTADTTAQKGNDTTEAPADTAPEDTDAADTEPTATEPPVTQPPVTQPPVVVQPEVYEAVADTYVANDGKTDMGAEDRIRVKKADTSSQTRNLFVTFDTSTTELTEVSRATLRLYCTWLSDKEAEIESRDLNLYVCSPEWTEASFTWDNQPEATEKILDVDDVSGFKSKSWLEFDVTEYVKAHNGEKMCFVLKNEGTDTAENHFDISSREKSGFAPQLVIE